MSSEICRESLPELPPVQHAGERVLTTELLASVYGVEPDRLHGNFSENRDRFTEGVHFVRLTGEALRAFKSYPGNSEVADKFARHLILWTERGAARHAKMLHTDAAWAIFGKLEESYFDDIAQPEPPAVTLPSPAASTREAVDTFEQWQRFTGLIGLDRNQGILAANRATRRAVGLDLLAETGQQQLEAPHQEVLMTVTELGKRLGGVKARATNIALTNHGFQIASRDARGELQYEATDFGRPYSRMIDQDRAKGSGAPVLQLRWLTSVVEPLKTAIFGPDSAG